MSVHALSRCLRLPLAAVCLSLLACTEDPAGKPPNDRPDFIPEECGPTTPPCTSDADCGQGLSCIESGCVAPRALDDWSFNGRWMVMTGLELPAKAEDCCADLDGDGKSDNAALSLLKMFGGFAGEAEKLDSAFDSFGVTLGVQLPSSPPADRCGPVDLAAFVMLPDVDGDGVADTTLEQRRAGEGVYVVDPRSYDDEQGTPRGRTPRSIWNGDVLRTSAGSFELPLQLGAGLSINAELEGVVLEIPVDAIASGALAEAEPVRVSVGGYVRIESIVGEINRNAASCACADPSGLDRTKPHLTMGFDTGKLKVNCRDPEAAGRSKGMCAHRDDGLACTNLDGMCTAALLLETMADVASGKVIDGDGDAVVDAISFGVYALMTEGALADVEVAPDFQAVGDHWVSRPYLNCNEDSPGCTLHLLDNDRLDLAVTDHLQSFSQPSQGEVVPFREDWKQRGAVRYVPPPGFSGEVAFDYTIVDRGGNTSSAPVTLVVYPRPPTELELFCGRFCEHRMGCEPQADAIYLPHPYDPQVHGTQVEACTNHYCLNHFAPLFEPGDETCDDADRAMNECTFALKLAPGAWRSDPFCLGAETETPACTNTAVTPTCEAGDGYYRALCVEDDVRVEASCAAGYPSCDSPCEPFFDWLSYQWNTSEDGPDYPCKAETQARRAACQEE